METPISNRKYSTSEGRKQPGDNLTVYSDNGKRIIGKVKNGTFTKYNYHSDRHYCYKHKAIGIDKGAFETVQTVSDLILVPDKTTGNAYIISVEDFQSNCIEDDLNWGPQVFCPLKHFKKVETTTDGVHQMSFTEVFGEFPEQEGIRCQTG